MSAKTANLKKISLEDMDDMPVEVSSTQAANDPDLLREDVPPANDADKKQSKAKDADMPVEKTELKDELAAEIVELGNKTDNAELELAVDESKQEKIEKIQDKPAKKSKAKKKSKAVANTAPPTPVVAIGRMHSTMKAARDEAQDDLASGISAYDNDGTAKPQDEAVKKEKKSAKKMITSAIPTPSSIKPSKGGGFGMKKVAKIKAQDQGNAEASNEDVAWNDVMPRLYGAKNGKAAWLEKRAVRYGVIIMAVLVLHSIVMQMMGNSWWGGESEAPTPVANKVVETPLPPTLAKMNKNKPVVERVKPVMAKQAPAKLAAPAIVPMPVAGSAVAKPVAKPQAKQSVVQPQAKPAIVAEKRLPVVPAKPVQNEAELLRKIQLQQKAIAPVAAKPANGVNEDILYKILSRH